MPRDALANPVVLATLGALLERPMHAYQLAGVLAGRGVPVNRGSLYDTLDATTRAAWTGPRPRRRGRCRGTRRRRVQSPRARAAPKTSGAWIRPALVEACTASS